MFNKTFLDQHGEFKELFHPYWLKFPPIDPLYHYLSGAYIGFAGIFGTFGNLLVIYIFLGSKPLRTPANLFIVNLAVSDLTFSAVNGFPLKTIAAFNQYWAWGKLSCVIYGFIGSVAGFASLLTNVMIALDRYFVIAQPFQGLRNLTYTRLSVMLGIVWVYATAISIPPLFGYGYYIPEGFQAHCSFDYISQDLPSRIWCWTMVLLGFTLNVLIIIWSYSGIVGAIRRHEREMIKMAEKLNNGQAGASMKSTDIKADVQAAKVALTTVSIWVLSWAPYCLITTFSMLGKWEYVTPLGTELPVLFAKTAAVLNPIVYAMSHPKFRLELEKKCPFLLCCCPPKPKEKQAQPTGQSVTIKAAAAET